MHIRLAVPADAPALLAIYAQYIETGITFEYQLPSREEFARRIRTFGEAYPYLVWEEKGQILDMPMHTGRQSGQPISGTQSCPSIWTGTTPAPAGAGGSIPP